MSAALALQARSLAARTAASVPHLASPARRLASLGDSMTAQYDYGQPGPKNAYGYQSWVEVLAGGAVYTDGSLNFGAAGERSDQILARVGQVVAARPGICVVLGGVNDVRTLTAQQTKANLRAIYAGLTAAGIRVVAVPILPAAIHAGTLLTAAEQRKLADINGWIRSVGSAGPGIVLADPSAMLIDPANALGAPIGAAPSGTTIPLAVTYDAANNPGGSKIGTDLWFATSGGTLGGGATGTVPTNWVLQRQSTGGTLAGAFEDEALGNGQVAKRYRLDLAASAGAGLTGRFYAAIYAGFAAGEVVEGAIEVEVSGVGGDALTSLQLQVSDNGGGYVRVLGSQTGTGAPDFRYPPADWRGLLRTKPFTVSAAASNALNFILSFALDGVAGAAATVRVKRARLARVAG